MIGLLCFALAVLASPFKSRLRLEAENAVLRHQVDRFAAQIAWPCPTRKQRSLVHGPAISLVSVYSSGSYNHPSGDAHPLAPIWLSLLLAMAVTIFGRPAADRDGCACRKSNSHIPM